MIFECKEPQVVKVGDPVDIRPVIRCEQCKFRKEDIPNSPTGYLCSNVFSGFPVTPNDGCTFGRRAVSNEEKFEEVFNIAFREFVADLKREDQLLWGISEYKEASCED